MGVLINHSISFVTSPLSVGLALLAAGLLAAIAGRRRTALSFGAVSLAWLWISSTGLAAGLLGLALERQYPPSAVAALPTADAIAVLGGGVGGDTNVCPYAELYPAADRVAHAARIWKAGKAPLVIPSGKNETVASLPFLLELGVPRSAIAVENESRNTEENARFVAAMGCRRIIVVTSSWHMRRALLMFRKYAPAVEVVPAACDYEATVSSARPFELSLLLPSADSLMHFTWLVKELVGYWGYRLLR